MISMTETIWAGPILTIPRANHTDRRLLMRDSGVYHIASQGNHTRSSTEALFSLWDESASDLSFSDGYLQVQLRADNPDTVLGIAMRAGVDEEGRPQGYLFSASANYGVLVIARYNGPTMDFIGPMPSVGFGPGSDWIFQAGAFDNRSGVQGLAGGPSRTPVATDHNDRFDLCIRSAGRGGCSKRRIAESRVWRDIRRYPVHFSHSGAARRFRRERCAGCGRRRTACGRNHLPNSST